MTSRPSIRVSKGSLPRFQSGINKKKNLLSCKSMTVNEYHCCCKGTTTSTLNKFQWDCQVELLLSKMVEIKENGGKKS